MRRPTPDVFLDSEPFSGVKMDRERLRRRFPCIRNEQSELHVAFMQDELAALCRFFAGRDGALRHRWRFNTRGRNSQQADDEDKAHNVRICTASAKPSPASTEVIRTTVLPVCRRPLLVKVFMARAMFCSGWSWFNGSTTGVTA